MRTASVSESAKPPRPEPRTSAICGRREVRLRISWAAASASTNWSGMRNFLEFLFELRVLSFQFPLFARALVGGEELGATIRRLFGAGDVGRARGYRTENDFRICPQT